MQRRFKSAQGQMWPEVYTDIIELGVDRRNEAKYRRRRKPFNSVIRLSVVTAIPAGTPHDRTRARSLIAQWANEYWHQTLREKRAANTLLPEAILSLPPGDLQTALRARHSLLASFVQDSWQVARGTVIQQRHNDLLTSFPWADWGGTVAEMMDEIHRHMLEPLAVAGLFWFDNLWTPTEVFHFLQERVNQFLLHTGLKRVVADTSIAAGQSEIPYPDVNELRRAIWLDLNGATTPLSLADYHTVDSGNPGWEATPGTPASLLTWGRGRYILSPTPSAAGTLRLDYIPDWNLATYTNAQIPYLFLPIPAIFIPFVKYGIMADMWGKEGEAHDSGRSDYCEERFEEGIEIAKMAIGRTD